MCKCLTLKNKTSGNKTIGFPLIKKEVKYCTKTQMVSKSLTVKKLSLKLNRALKTCHANSSASTEFSEPEQPSLK